MSARVPSARVVRSAVKATLQTISTATLTNVTDISLALAANEVWQAQIEGRCVVDGSGSISVKLTAPSGATVTGTFSAGATLGSKLTENTQLDVTPGGASATHYFVIPVVIVCGSTPGTFALQMSEFVHGAGVQVAANTSLLATKLKP